MGAQKARIGVGAAWRKGRQRQSIFLRCRLIEKSLRFCYDKTQNKLYKRGEECMIYTPDTKKAMKLCFEAHKEQKDKSGMPYVFHPFHIAEQMPDEKLRLLRSFMM